MQNGNSIMPHVRRGRRLLRSITPVVAAMAMWVTASHAQLTVTTLGGGNVPPVAPNGYVDGITLQSRFDNVHGLALSSSGRFLYLADSENDAIRLSDLETKVTRTFASNLVSRPSGIAVDRSDNVYVLNQATTASRGAVIKFNSLGNPLGILMTNLNFPTAIALDGSTNLYVLERGGQILRITPAGVTNSLTTVAPTAGLLNPIQAMGLVVLDNGHFAVSDAANHAIYQVDSASFAVSLLTGGNGSGAAIGAKAFAQFNAPRGLAKAGNGMILVADELNHRVQAVQVSSGTSTNLYGVSPDLWFEIIPTGSGDAFPMGWDDGNPASSPPRGASARNPVALVVAGDSTVFAFESYYDILRQVTGSQITAPGDGTGGGDAGGTIVVPVPTASPLSGYFPMGTTITVNSTIPDVYYTTDGTEPTTNSAKVTISGNTGSIRWLSATNDLRDLRLRSFLGTNASAVVTGSASSTNVIQAVGGQNTNILAGVGSTVLVPIVVNLTEGQGLKSYQFRAEISPVTAGPMVSDKFQLVALRTNDFVSVVSAGEDGVVPTPINYTLPPSTRGLAVSALGVSSGISITNFGTLALLSIPIPSTAVVGQQYQLQILNPSATSDGVQANVGMVAGPSLTILVTNRSYLVGDVSPGGWYNVGDFGDGELDNGDVNAILLASLLIKQPFPNTDVFNAMDVSPVDLNGIPNSGGNGEIRFIDYITVLRRALRLDTNNFTRVRLANGTINSVSVAPLANTPAPVLSEPLPGDIWTRHATLSSTDVLEADAGQTVKVPVQVSALPGVTLDGMMFRAVVSPRESAPNITRRPTFTQNAALSSTSLLGPTESPINDVSVIWNSGLSLSGGSNYLLGELEFTIPSSASPGQSYAVHFVVADGASADLTTEYNFQTRRSTVWVGIQSPDPQNLLSDEWKLFFFGSLDNPEGAMDADPDGDGLTNYQEFLAGTHPTSAQSQLKFSSSERRDNGGVDVVVLKFISAPGVLYDILRSKDFIEWSKVGSVLGTGAELEVQQPLGSQGPGFYRVRVSP